MRERVSPVRYEPQQRMAVRERVGVRSLSDPDACAHAPPGVGVSPPLGNVLGSMVSGSPAVAGVLMRCDQHPWRAEPGAATAARAARPAEAEAVLVLLLLRLRVPQRCGRSHRRASDLPLLRPWRLSRPRPRRSRSDLRQPQHPLHHRQPHLRHLPQHLLRQQRPQPRPYPRLRCRRLLIQQRSVLVLNWAVRLRHPIPCCRRQRRRGLSVVRHRRVSRASVRVGSWLAWILARRT